MHFLGFLFLMAVIVSDGAILYVASLCILALDAFAIITNLLYGENLILIPFLIGFGIAIYFLGQVFKSKPN